MTPELATAVETRFPGRRVVVIGDAVADQFLTGTISRVSREAPVFILRHDQTVTLPGAAANAAANIAALGAASTLVGVVGNDRNGNELVKALTACGVETDGIVKSGPLATTTKVRVLAAQNYSPRQQVIRIDYEPSCEAVQELAARLSGDVKSRLQGADAIVVSDYGYGVVTDEIFATVKAFAHDANIPLVVDSRYRLGELQGATSATPNREEVRNIVGDDCDDNACEALRLSLGLDALLVTNGNEGISLFAAEEAPFRMAAVGSAEPVDVTGAGDTVIATYALGLAAGLSYKDAAIAANHAGGIVVMKKATATVSLSELSASLRASGPRTAGAA